MISRVIGFLEQRSHAFVASVALLLLVFLGIIDWATGPLLAFSVFYLLPVSLVAWTMTRGRGVTISVLAAITSLLAEVLTGRNFGGPLVPVWNTWARLGGFLIVVALLGHVKASLEQEKEISRTDFLTGVPNSRAFQEAVEVELKRARRQSRPITLVYIDVDGFKKINDRMGHSGGDFVLRSIANALHEHTRVTDVVARLGGDEFGLLLPETDEDGAGAVIASLSRRVSDALEGIDPPVAFSTGWATFREPPDTVDEMIRAADEAMYAAKRSDHTIAESVREPA